MKTLYIILALFLFGAASASSQTLKTLSYNTTNGFVVAATNVTFTNSVGFATNAQAETRTNLGLGATWLTNTNVTNFRSAIGGTTVGNAVFTAAGAASAANAIGLGITNDVRFNTLQFDGSPTQPTNFSQLGLRATASGFGGFYSYYDGAFKFAFAAANLSNNIQDIIIFRTSSVQLATPLQFVGTNAAINAATTRTNLGLGATWLTNSASPLFWTSVPASPTNSGTAGQVAYTNNYLYICISNNTWRRVQLGTW